MQEQNGLNPEQRELELTLKSLSPWAAQIDPIAAAFAAGRKSTRRRTYFWQAAAAIMLLIGAGSWLPLPRRADVVPMGRLTAISVAIQSPLPRSEPLSPQSLLVLQEAVLKKGLDGLPAVNIPSIQSVHAEDIF